MSDPLTCGQVLDQLGPLADNELDSITRALVESHVAGCPRCAAAHEKLTSLDEFLRASSTSVREQSATVADRVLANTPAPRPSTTTITRQTPRILRRLAVVAAASVALLLVIRPPQRPSHDPPVQTIPSPAANAVPVAFVVRATGPLEFQDPATQAWERVELASIPSLACPESSSIRTVPGTLVELETSNGTKLRLNEKTEVSLASPDDLELRTGHLWCQTGSANQVTIKATPLATDRDQSSGQTSLTLENLAACACTSPDSVATVFRQPDGVQVTAGSGNVEVTLGEQKHSIPAGRTASVSRNGVEVNAPAVTSLNAERWMQPLLAMAGHGNPELSQRVESLLADLGATKASWMRETDLRALGEYAAVPLIEFVKQERSTTDAVKRRRAMSIAADTAPVWTVPDLIALLDDKDAAIQASAAKALTRLTGQSPARDMAKASWTSWWEQNARVCIPPTQQERVPRAPSL